MGNKIVRVIFFLIVLAALTVIAGVWMVWKRPLTVDAWMSRTALKINGLEKTELATDAGTMTVWRGGEGPVMVLLHGAGDQAGAWARVVGDLVADHRLVIPDLPGHDGSDPSSGPIHMAQLLDGVDRVMDSVPGDEPVVLVGNSLGAWLGFLYVAQHPDRVERLVAVNGGPLFNPNPNGVNLFPKNREEAAETLRALMGPASPPIPGYVLDDVVRRMSDGPAARFAATAAEWGPYLLDGRLDEVTVPVELVWGDADLLMTVGYAGHLANGLPRARLHLVEGCGHVPQRECPTAFLEVLDEALAEPPPPPEPETDEVAGGTPAPQEIARDRCGARVSRAGGAWRVAEARGPRAGGTPAPQKEGHEVAGGTPAPTMEPGSTVASLVVQSESRLCGGGRPARLARADRSVPGAA